MEDDRWWSVFGRLAAPTFFFLMGYAQTRTVPLTLDLARCHPDPARKLERRLDLGGTEHSFELGTHPHCASLCANPFATSRLGRLRPPRLRTFRGAADSGKIVDYGAEGWLWALFGLYQRMYVDGRSATDVDGAAQSSAPPAHAMTENAGLMRLLACFVAVVVYVWQEQREFSFPQIQFAVFILRHRRFVRLPVSVPARPEPHPTARSHSRRPALHRSAHFGNLRHPACRLRTPCKAGARSRPLTQDRVVAKRSCRSGATSLLAPYSIRNVRPSWARAHSARARCKRFPARLR